MALTEVNPGRIVKIENIHGGKGVQRKLMALGLIPGVPVKVLQSRRGAPVLVSVFGSSLTLGYGLSQKIIVK